jgi:hypothetical protein
MPLRENQQIALENAWNNLLAIVNLIEDETDKTEIKAFLQGKINQSFPQNMSKRQAPANRISVLFTDGRTVSQPTNSATLCKVIEIIGVEKVFHLGVKRFNMPIVSPTRIGGMTQKEVGGYWILTTSTTEEKIEQLKIISEKLDLNLVIE